MVQDGSFIIPLFKFFLQNKCLTESVYIFPQPDILLVHFFIASFKLKYTDFINASSVGYSDFVFVYFLNCLFRLSIGFVVSISFLIFVFKIRCQLIPVASPWIYYRHILFPPFFLLVHPVCFLLAPMLVHCTFLSGLMWSSWR